MQLTHLQLKFRILNILIEFNKELLLILRMCVATNRAQKNIDYHFLNINF